MIEKKSYQLTLKPITSNPKFKDTVVIDLTPPFDKVNQKVVSNMPEFNRDFTLGTPAFAHEFDMRIINRNREKYIDAFNKKKLGSKQKDNCLVRLYEMHEMK
eukprot:TRINITY_DN338_c0_g1_i2.p2 TRINITY_DN338_c0_g1~~TRINITY_DN338_c0_g1_i2.p2  ORF type:complete len:102 (+),score=21.55 TRINITY_DN338_c0_g1_i2:43-348(+)